MFNFQVGKCQRCVPVTTRAIMLLKMQVDPIVNTHWLIFRSNTSCRRDIVATTRTAGQTQEPRKTTFHKRASTGKSEPRKKQVHMN
mmetsp:Transcript_6356/g.7817  ORF Transcript_6356/g.7817 Transcript_6356/m.7817 type:complete len:86 (-) Transcript_6356:944-1201(-)